jgi:hypothetical protein
MSDYFGALMTSSGLTDPPGTSVHSRQPSDAAPDADADIVELDAMHDADGHVSRPQQGHGPLPAGDAALPSAAWPAGAAPPAPIPVPSVPGPSSRPPANNAPASAGADAATGIVSDTIVNSPGTASQDASRSRMIRAAVEWVAADPHNIGTMPGAEARASPGARADSGPVAIEATQTPGSPTDMTPAQIVRGAPSPTPPASRARPASIAEDVVEISIGAIHVRVDAPAPSTTARIAPQEGAPSRPSPARPTTHSALSRRALRRI